MNNLRFAGVDLSPLDLYLAYQKYSAGIDNCFSDGIRYLPALLAVEESAVVPGQYANELKQLRTVQARLQSRCDEAEGQLFEDLAAATSTRADGKLRLGRLRDVRRVEMEIECISRRAAGWGRRTELPLSLPQLILSSDAAAWSPLDRAAVLEVLLRHCAGRIAAWKKSEPELDRAIDEYYRTRSLNDGSSFPTGDFEGVSLQVRRSLLGAEISLLQDLIASVSPSVSGRLMSDYGSKLCADWVWREQALSLPTIQNQPVSTVRELAQVMLSLPGIERETRAKVRAKLLEWMARDAKLTEERLAERMARLQYGKVSLPSSGLQPSEARAALAKSYLQDLQTLLAFPWLVPDGVIPQIALEALESADIDTFGSEFISARSLSFQEAESRPDTQSYGAGLSPKPCLLALLAVSAGEKSSFAPTDPFVLESLIADARDEWQRAIEPDTRQIANASAERRAAREDDGTMDRAWKSVIEAQPLRKRSWEHALELESRVLDSLAAVTAPEHSFYIELCARYMGMGQDAVLSGCAPMRSAAWRILVPNVIDAGLHLRCTASERNAIAKAICSEYEGWNVQRLGSIKEALMLQDEYENQRSESLGCENSDLSNEEKAEANKALHERAVLSDHRALRLCEQLRAANTDLLARASAQLPSVIAERWQRAVALYGTVDNLRYLDSRRATEDLAIKVRFHGAPVPEATLIESEKALDAWEIRAMPIIHEVAAHLKVPEPSAMPLNSVHPHLFALSALLGPSYADQIDAYVYLWRHSLPAISANPDLPQNTPKQN